jgi:hypothetical protein
MAARKKPYYYIVWIEGLSYKRGEKIHYIDRHGNVEYTTKMMEAMRVKPEDVNELRHWLKRHGISQWTLDNAFVGVNYAPKDTIYKP